MRKNFSRYVLVATALSLATPALAQNNGGVSPPCQGGWFVLLSVIILLLLLVLPVLFRPAVGSAQKTLPAQTADPNNVAITPRDPGIRLPGPGDLLLQNIQMRETLISLVVHDLRSHVRFLTLLAGELHDNLEQLSAGKIKERTALIRKGANDIYTFSEDFLLWVSSRKNDFRITRQLFPLKPVLREACTFFKEQAEQKGNGIFYEATGDPAVYSDPHILLTIVRNLVDNANKYTDGGKITLRAYEEAAYTVVAVTDTGKGMSPQQTDAFLRNGNMDNITSGSQLGHKFIFDLSQTIDGLLSIESRENEGTTVTLRFRKEGA